MASSKPLNLQYANSCAKMAPDKGYHSREGLKELERAMEDAHRRAEARQRLSALAWRGVVRRNTHGASRRGNSMR